mgnify:CR=1 FL=1
MFDRPSFLALKVHPSARRKTSCAISAADFAAFPFLKYALIPKLPDDDEPFHKVLDDHQQLGDDHPQLKAWIERVDALPRA